MAAFNELEGIAFSAARAGPALRKLLEDASLGLVEVLERDGALAGYYVVTWGYDLEWNGRDAFLTELYIERALRRQGHGRALLQRAEERARANQARALHLMVRLDNGRARALYERAGYASPPRVFLSKVLAK